VRNRIVIGVLAALVVGTAAFMLLQPQPGSLEWHKRQYLAAANRLAKNRFSDRLGRMFSGLTRKPPARKIQTARAERETAVEIEKHRKALARLGYLAEKRFALRYCAVDQIKLALANTAVTGPGVRNGRFWISAAGDTVVTTAPQGVLGHFSISTERNTIVVTAPPAVMSNYEEQIRKADATGF
jgi:hypothetical protein